MIPLDLIISKLERVKRTGDGQAKAKGAAHEDHKLKLSLSTSDDHKTQVKCWTDCTFDAIGAAVRLKLVVSILDCLGHANQRSTMGITKLTSHDHTKTVTQWPMKLAWRWSEIMAQWRIGGRITTSKVNPWIGWSGGAWLIERILFSLCHISPRARVGCVIQQARRDGRYELARSMRDAWQERIAIATIDGGEHEHVAEKIAADEVVAMARGNSKACFKLWLKKKFKRVEQHGLPKGKHEGKI